MSIWQFQTLLTRRLLQWSIVSTLLGGVMLFGQAFWRGVGSQFVGWALINAAIAYFGGEGARRREAAENANEPQRMNREARNLWLLLWVNTLLDLLYVRGGLWLALRRKSSLFTRGMGIGIIVQGVFLFVFDFLHASQVPSGKRRAR